MKVLALDVGERRIGVALSDPSGVVARGLTVIRRTDLPADLAAVRRLVEEAGAGRILVGLPLNMDGTEGEMARRVRGFAIRLESALEGGGGEVLLWDERLSTEEAEEELRRRGLGWKERKEVVDQVAAAAILQEYLDDLAAGGGGVPEAPAGD